MNGAGGHSIPLTVQDTTAEPVDDDGNPNPPYAKLARPALATDTTIYLDSDLPTDQRIGLAVNVFDSQGAATLKGRQFKVRIDDEILLMTGRPSPNLWQVVRGIDGTVPAKHEKDAKARKVYPNVVYLDNVLTAQSRDNLTVGPGLLNRGISEAVLRYSPASLTQSITATKTWSVPEALTQYNVGTGGAGIYMDGIPPGGNAQPGDGSLTFLYSGVWLIVAQMDAAMTCNSVTAMDGSKSIQSGSATGISVSFTSRGGGDLATFNPFSPALSFNPALDGIGSVASPPVMPQQRYNIDSVTFQQSSIAIATLTLGRAITNPFPQILTWLKVFTQFDGFSSNGGTGSASMTLTLNFCRSQDLR